MKKRTSTGLQTGAYEDTAAITKNRRSDFNGQSETWKREGGNLKRSRQPRNIVGPVLRELREKKGLTQAQFVSKINLLGWDISRDTYAKIESQIRWVADFEILKLAKGIGIDAPELLRRAAKVQRKP